MTEKENIMYQILGVENKPNFDQIYSHLSNFVKPFANKDTSPRVWNSSKLIWEEDYNRTFA
ncbi:MAG: hypothetical protein FWC47_03530 [Oscillospiraceae bacterium]|nr:hypothetical protein [Oscillospiraceae bacterium]